MPFLLAQNAPVSVQLSTVVAIAAVVTPVMLALLGAMVTMGLWIVRREISHKDAAHKALETKIDHTRAELKVVEVDLKTLLAGQSRVEGLLEGMARWVGSDPLADAH